jgi:hypothetical protein
MASSPRAAERVRLEVTETFTNGEERCEVRWPVGQDFNFGPYVRDWRRMRDVNFWIDEATGEAVLLFTRDTGTVARNRRNSPCRR